MWTSTSCLVERKKLLSVDWSLRTWTPLTLTGVVVHASACILSGEYWVIHRGFLGSWVCPWREKTIMTWQGVGQNKRLWQVSWNKWLASLIPTLSQATHKLTGVQCAVPLWILQNWAVAYLPTPYKRNLKPRCQFPISRRKHKRGRKLAVAEGTWF